MKRFYTTILIFLFWAAVNVVVMAQPGDGGDEDPDVPITGIELLIGLGGLWGAKKVYNKSKRSNK